MSAAVTVAPAARSGTGSAFAGTRTLVRFILRRDRIRMPVWVLVLAGLQLMYAASYPQIYPTVRDRQDQAALYEGNPGLAALSGPGYGLDDYTYGAMYSNELLGFLVVFVALMSVLLMGRHTRAEEESGSAELVRGAVVGRYAPLTAALLAVGGASVVLGLLVTAGLGSLGIESVTWTGSIAYGAAMAMVGLVFAGAAAVAGQVTEHSRAAAGIAGTLIGAAYVLRAVGDMGGSGLSWLSPIGWAQATRPYVDERWWPLGLSGVATALLVVAAYAICARRDLGAGLWRSRPGRARASALLGTPQGLAWRLQRAGFVWWLVALSAVGAMYGSFANIIGDYADNEFVQGVTENVGGATLIESWLAMIISVVAMVCGIFAIIAVLRPRREETSGRAEPVLATALSRSRWLATHVVVGMAGGTALLFASGLGLGLTAAASLGDSSWVGEALGATLAYAPALWVTTAFAVTVFGVIPRATALAWALLAYSIAIGYLGTILQAPDWAFDLSPYGHVPRMPADGFTVAPLVALTVLAAALLAGGVVGLRRRDLESN